jgi:hypothetical protein
MTAAFRAFAAPPKPLSTSCSKPGPDLRRRVIAPIVHNSFEDNIMAAFNVVRFRVKAGEQEFLDAHRKSKANFSGSRQTVMIRTGERAYCLVGEWENIQSLVNARPAMIAVLDTSAARWRSWVLVCRSPTRCRARSC